MLPILSKGDKQYVLTIPSLIFRQVPYRTKKLLVSTTCIGSEISSFNEHIE